MLLTGFAVKILFGNELSDNLFWDFAVESGLLQSKNVTDFPKILLNLWSYE